LTFDVADRVELLLSGGESSLLSLELKEEAGVWATIEDGDRIALLAVLSRVADGVA